MLTVHFYYLLTDLGKAGKVKKKNPLKLNTYTLKCDGTQVVYCLTLLTNLNINYNEDRGVRENTQMQL